MKKHLLITLLLSIIMGTNSFSQNPCCDYTLTASQPGISGETFGIALGDIDGDGDNDAVVVDAYDDMEVYINDGAADFTYDQTYGSGKSWFGVDLVDVDLDGDLDIIVAAFYSGGGCEVWLNDGMGDFTFSQGSIASSISMRKLGIGDLNGNGYPDIFAPAYSGGSSQVWFNDGSGTFINSNQALSGSSCTQAALADLDGDNDLDAYISRTNGTPNTVWLNNGAGFFGDTGQSLGAAFSNGAGASDVDDDGDIDIVVSNWQVPSQVWLNDGSAFFTTGFQINNDNYAKAIEISDIDYDCDDDVIIGSYGSNGVQVWTNNGLGEFSLCFENSSSNSVYCHDIAVADLNNDLMPDIWAGSFSSSSGDRIFLKSTPEVVYDTLILCPDDSLFVGCEWRLETGDFLEAINCDTLVWYHISENIIDTMVTQNQDTLFAQLNYTSYQWFNCETMINIPGADNYYYVSDTSGSFAVEITNQSCVDTSSCHWIQIPLADFEGTPTVGEAPLLVTFTDLSVFTVDTWLWDFGDGNTSTEQNPVYEYVFTGDYTVTLMITGPGGADTLTKVNYIDVNFITPTADFVGTPTSGTVPLEVTFTNLSVDSVNTWNWDFGDGESSYLESPVHTYVTEGVYTVSLTVGGPGGSNEMIKTDYITATAEPPVADFEGTPITGNIPLLVSFTDLSTGSIDTWDWDFGDGGSSNIQFPEHTYVTAGTYTVSLAVTGAGGSNEMVKTDYITVTTDAPVADFEGTPTTGEAPLLVSFTDLSTGSIDTWSWEFGDGDSSSEQNPEHEYLTPGNFTVSLTATGLGGSDIEVKVDYILIPVGLEENSMEAIVVYPNPVTDNLQIIFPNNESRSITLKNMDGKQVFEMTSSSKEEVLDLQKFVTGVYSLVIRTDNNTVSIIKVVKK